jgi:hypothetical protein
MFRANPQFYFNIIILKKLMLTFTLIQPGIASKMPLLFVSKVISNNFIFTRTRTRTRRYSSSIEHNEIDPNYNYYCSLDRLAYNIHRVYTEFPDTFCGLTDQHFMLILKSVMNGTYTVGPYILRNINRNEYPDHDAQKSFVVSVSSKVYLCLNPSLEDKVVLTALAFMLNENFFYLNLFTDKSFINMDLYYSTVCARGKVLKVYKLDLLDSVRTIDREGLLLKLLHIVKDEAIMKIVGEFLSAPILDESGGDYRDYIECCIPPMGPITAILLNFALIEFDNEFQRTFPYLDYSRHINEVFVYIPPSESTQGLPLLVNNVIPLEIFEQQLYSLFDKQNLVCEMISIKPGDAPVPCNGGLVSVSHDGEIQVQRKGWKKV